MPVKSMYKEKGRIIGLINQDLLDNGQPQLTVHDFEILCDLDLDELLEARVQIVQQIRSYSVSVN